MCEREQGRAGGRRSALGSSGKAPRRKQLESGRRASRGRREAAAGGGAEALRAGGGRARDLFAPLPRPLRRDLLSPGRQNAGRTQAPVARQVRRSPGRPPALCSLLFAGRVSRARLSGRPRLRLNTLLPWELLFWGARSLALEPPPQLSGFGCLITDPQNK